MLQVANLSKEYPPPRGPLPVLSGVSFVLAPGEAAAIMGPSGSGKSSLLYVLGALEPPTSGTVTLDGRNPFQLGADELAAFRNTAIGFVFQDHCLLPQCTVLENVLIPTLVAPKGEDDSTRRAREGRGGGRNAVSVNALVDPETQPVGVCVGLQSHDRAHFECVRVQASRSANLVGRKGDTVIRDADRAGRQLAGR